VVEDRIAAVARKQHGVLTLAQLLDTGLAKGAVERRTKSGFFRRLHHGVYLVGPAPLPRSREMAAVLACGSSTLLSHRSAISAWGMAPGRPAPIAVEVMVIGRHAPKRPGIRARRVSGMDDSERTQLDGIPITTPARTLLDYALLATPRESERAIAVAYREGLATPAELAGLVARRKGRPGVRALRQVLADHPEPAFTRSEAEERLLALIRAAKLPPPEVNALVDGYEIDFFWREARVAVEVDGYRYHSSRHSFEKDRRRAVHFAARGVQVVPVSWRQIVDSGLATVVQISQALALRG
jgi:very-short-patch-repair endonuclease